MPAQTREKTRRFLPEPIETSSRSSKDNPTSTSEGATRGSPARPEQHKFRDFPDSQRQHGSVSPLYNPIAHAPPRANCRYELESHPNSRSHGSDPPRALSDHYLPSSPEDRSLEGQNTSRRRFVPQLMETGTRSFRRPPTVEPLSLPATPWREQSRKSERSRTTDDGAGASLGITHESRFSYSSLRQRHETRRHSFRVPSLPDIPSSCSEASGDSSVSSHQVSPHATPVVRSNPSNPPDDRRESCDERFATYLLSLAAHATEKQLQDQALAAFPNEQVHQPVDHFAIDREEDDTYVEGPLSHAQSGELRSRRTSSADLSWELEYMRRHKLEAEMRDRAMAGTKEPRLSRDVVPPDNVSGYLGCTRAMPHTARASHAKRPPMLGDDLVFPQSLSPENTICEGNTDSEQTRELHSSSGLWHADSHQRHNFENDGLWMGTCRVDKNSPDNVRVNVMPSIQDKVTDEGARAGCIETQNSESREQSVERRGSGEFDDGFVTQIYNYLSLGYPCVARYYDHELSKVSGIALSDLRRDDLNTDAKGYVSVTKDTETRTFCMRWKALRIYIREWVKQQPAVAEDDDAFDTWGVRERRGSWAG